MKKACRHYADRLFTIFIGFSVELLFSHRLHNLAHIHQVDASREIGIKFLWHSAKSFRIEWSMINHLALEHRLRLLKIRCSMLCVSVCKPMPLPCHHLVHYDAPYSRECPYGHRQTPSP